MRVLRIVNAAVGNKLFYFIKVLTGYCPGSPNSFLDYIGGWHINSCISSSARPANKLIHPLARSRLNFPENIQLFKRVCQEFEGGSPTGYQSIDTAKG